MMIMMMMRRRSSLVTSCCRWRKRPSDAEGICEYDEQRIVSSRKGVVLQLGKWAGANNFTT
jgi:hypothetical protein